MTSENDAATDVLSQLQGRKFSPEEFAKIEDSQSKREFIENGMRVVAAQNRRNLAWLWQSVSVLDAHQEAAFCERVAEIKDRESLDRVIAEIGDKNPKLSEWRELLAEGFRWFAGAGGLSQCGAVAVRLDLRESCEEIDRFAVDALAEIDDWLSAMEYGAMERADDPPLHCAFSADILVTMLAIGSTPSFPNKKPEIEQRLPSRTGSKRDSWEELKRLGYYSSARSRSGGVFLTEAGKSRARRVLEELESD